jgi:hypothetical protein
MSLSHGSLAAVGRREPSSVGRKRAAQVGARDRGGRSVPRGMVEMLRGRARKGLGVPESLRRGYRDACEAERRRGRALKDGARTVPRPRPTTQ